jgi:hypothetical protein
MQAAMVISIPNEGAPLGGRSTPETAVAEEAFVHPALDFVGDVPAGEAEMDGDVFLHPALPPLEEAAEQPTERTGLTDRARRLAVGGMMCVGENRHVRLLFFEISE